MIEISSDAHIVADQFRVAASIVPFVFAATVREAGDDLLATIKRYASGHDGGPKIVTQRYYDSIRSNFFSVGSGGYIYEVGTDEEYGDMLEFGGTTTTPNGETITHKPHPHFNPAMDYMETEFVKRLDVGYAEVIRSVR